jgi:hypothetical protein
MKNPCDVCIVKACCTLFCEDKVDFTSCLNEEVASTRKYIYSISGNKRKKVSRNITLQWESKQKLLKINLREIKTIINRGNL